MRGRERGEGWSTEPSLEQTLQPSEKTLGSNPPLGSGLYVFSPYLRGFLRQFKKTQVGLIDDCKIVNVNGCLSLCVRPVVNW